MTSVPRGTKNAETLADSARPRPPTSRNDQPIRRLLPARLLAALRPEATGSLDLPADFIRDARNRVRIAAALVAAAYASFLALELTRSIPSSDLEHRIDLAHDVAGLGLCLLLLGVASLPKLRDRIVLGAALAFEVALSALIAIGHSWASFVHTGSASALSWVVPLILVFPLLVPAPPRVGLAFSLLSAATLPGALAALSGIHVIEVAPSEYLSTTFTGLVAVGISFVLSRTLHGAGRQLAAARIVGSYEMIERLAEGGMGEVWRARHRFLARPAAVKLILPEMLQGRAERRDHVLERFTREARVTASLRSPHTVELFDFGAAEGGTLYYAMELLEGLNAEHFVYRFGPIEPRRAVHWLRQVCHSLGEAHSRGLLHRDLKPANVFLCRNGRDADFVKVLDFGLTRTLGAPEDSRITRSGVVMGTPGYMAPEQIYGGECEPRSDLYALGCVAYFLLTGAGPFDSDASGDLLRQHAQAPPPPLSARCPRPIPERLESAVMSCLAKEASARPESADALDARLGSALDGEPWSHASASAWWSENLGSEAGVPVLPH